MMKKEIIVQKVGRSWSESNLSVLIERRGWVKNRLIKLTVDYDEQTNMCTESKEDRGVSQFFQCVDRKKRMGKTD